MIAKRQKRTKRNYFTEETEDAILLYNRTKSKNKQSKIYSKDIHYAFFKLTQNIIHTFKFYHTGVEDLEHLQHEIIVFLLDKIHLYHHSKSINDRLTKIIIKEFKGKYELESFLKYTKNSDKVTQKQINDFLTTLDVSDECMVKLKKLTPPKAYSYFGTIVKRWCINHNDKVYKKKLSTLPAEDLNHDINHSYLLDSNDPTKDQLSLFIDDFVDHLTENLETIFPKPKDAKVADAVLELFRKRDKIDVFNKKALYIYIREQGEFSTPKITKISKKIYDLFKKYYIFYLNQGYVNFNKV